MCGLKVRHGNKQGLAHSIKIIFDLPMGSGRFSDRLGIGLMLDF
jgi:hypothetical protein